MRSVLLATCLVVLAALAVASSAQAADADTRQSLLGAETSPAATAESVPTGTAEQAPAVETAPVACPAAVELLTIPRCGQGCSEPFDTATCIGYSCSGTLAFLSCSCQGGAWTCQPPC